MGPDTAFLGGVDQEVPDKCFRDMGWSGVQWTLLLFLVLEFSLVLSDHLYQDMDNNADTVILATCIFISLNNKLFALFKNHS